MSGILVWFGLLAGAAALLALAGAFGKLLKELKQVKASTERLDSFFSPEQKLVFLDEDDTQGHVLSGPSRLESAIAKGNKPSPDRPTKVRQRILVDLAIKDPVLREELNSLRGKGDGRWMGVLVEKMCSKPGRARELIDLRSKYAVRGWSLASLEPAYDSGDGLCVWIELEKELKLDFAELAA